jgi:hypothetical protein
VSFLYAYPDWIIFTVIVSAVTAASVVVMLAVAAVIPNDHSKESFDLALRVMASIIAINTFMLAFAVVQAKNRIVQIEQGVKLEAASLGALDRLLLRYDEAATAPARATLKRYIASIVEDEWPAMSRAEESHEAQAMVHDLVRVVTQLQPANQRQQALYAELLHALDEVENRRENRVADMDGALPALFWAVIVALCLLGMASGGLFRPRLVTVLMIAAQGMAIGFMVAFIFTLDEPFLGDATVTPAPYERLLHQMSEAQ